MTSDPIVPIKTGEKSKREKILYLLTEDLVDGKYFYKCSLRIGKKKIWVQPRYFRGHLSRGLCRSYKKWKHL